MRKRWGKCGAANRFVDQSFHLLHRDKRLQRLKRNWFVMEYIDPALLEGHKFDLRTYLLVASLNPFLVFYHDGFVRRVGPPLLGLNCFSEIYF